MGNPQQPPDRPIGDIAEDLVASDATETRGGRPGKQTGVTIGGQPINILGAIAAVAIGVAAVGAAIGGFVALNRGGGTSSPTPTPASVVQPAQSPSPPPTTAAGATPTASTGAARPLLTGTYSGTFAVADDPNGHDSFIGSMPTQLDVFIGRDTNTRAVTLEISGDAPFIPVTSVGSYDETTGAFNASGSGDVTSRQIPVTATMDGTLIGGELSASLTFTGTPNGPITYDIDMTNIAGP